MIRKYDFVLDIVTLFSTTPFRPSEIIVEGRSANATKAYRKSIVGIMGKPAISGYIKNILFINTAPIQSQWRVEVVLTNDKEKSVIFPSHKIYLLHPYLRALLRELRERSVCLVNRGSVNRIIEFEIQKTKMLIKKAEGIFPNV